MTNKRKVFVVVIVAAVMLAGIFGFYLNGGNLMGFMRKPMLIPGQRNFYSKEIISKEITRAELAKLVVLTTAPNADLSSYGGGCYSDVPENSKNVNYICYLEDKSIMVEGHVYGFFEPNEPISRGEAASVFWYAYADVIGWNGTLSNNNFPQNVNDALLGISPPPYLDVSPSIPPYWGMFICGDAALGIFEIEAWAPERPLKFFPDKMLTRGVAQHWADKLAKVLGN